MRNKRPNADHVQSAIAAVLAATRPAGKPAGILAPVKTDADRYLADGFTMLAIGSDLGLLARASDALVAAFKRWEPTCRFPPTRPRNPAAMTS